MTRPLCGDVDGRGALDLRSLHAQLRAVWMSWIDNQPAVDAPCWAEIAGEDKEDGRGVPSPNKVPEPSLNGSFSHLSAHCAQAVPKPISRLEWRLR